MFEKKSKNFANMPQESFQKGMDSCGSWMKEGIDDGPKRIDKIRKQNIGKLKANRSKSQY